jgi:hypothetical protein
MAAKKKTYRDEGVDPRHSIAMTYDAFHRLGANHLQKEYEDKLNNVSGPGEAMALSSQYRRMARDHFDAGHDGAKA